MANTRIGFDGGVSSEMDKLNVEGAEKAAFDYARKVMERQIPKSNSMEGFYGHFYEFKSMDHAEPSWVHGIVPSDNGSQFGTDMGGVYPNYLVPVINLLKKYPNHEDARKMEKNIN